MIVNERTLEVNQRAQSGVRIKTIALPAEHGAWSFLLEPMLLGLLLAPSIAGLYLALAVTGFFLARHPLTLAILSRKRSSPRTALAKRFAALYLVIGVSSFIAAIGFTQHLFVLPMLMATPFAIVQVAHDWTGSRRVLMAEIAGAIAISSLAAALALSGGWSKPASFALWGIMIARAVPAILYVRACLTHLHHHPASPVPMLVAHVFAVAVALACMRAGLVSSFALVVMLMLLGRALLGFANVQKLTAKRLGFSEIGFGATTVCAIVFGNPTGL